MSDESSTITFRLPLKLREKIQARATAEERSEAGFIRFYLGQLFAMEEAETQLSEESAEVAS